MRKWMMIVEEVSFKTAMGSTYVVLPDGRTVRDKAYRAQHGEGEQGPQPTSEMTFYVTDDNVAKLGEFQARGYPGRKRIVVSSTGSHAAVGYEGGPSSGKLERRTLVTIQHNPAVGLIPVEIWDQGRRVHFGNKIVEITRSETN